MEIFSYIKLIIGKEFDFGKEFFFVIVFCMLFVDVCGILIMEVDLEWYGGCFIIIEI